MDVKGVLRNLGLTEEDPHQVGTKTTMQPESRPVRVVSEPMPEPVTASAVATSTATSVQDFYAEQGFGEGGVFQLQAFMSTMPATLPDTQKVTTVMGILTASKLSLADFKLDADKRVGALESHAELLKAQTDEAVTNATKAIAALNEEIARYQQSIQEKTELNDKAQKEFKAEIDRVKAIVGPFQNIGITQ